ncbi:hypothetical protein [Massilia consociata]|uniref:Uncharacterized protein n=1 Tax=Massilia consociata TaxID=760117 RepID=A0ABV6FB01_9BURK
MNSVSASSRPAIIAPSAIDRPAAADRDIAGQQAEPEGADQHAGSQEADYLVDAQALQGGNQDAGEHQEEEDFPQEGEGMLLLHGCCARKKVNSAAIVACVQRSRGASW